MTQPRYANQDGSSFGSNTGSSNEIMIPSPNPRAKKAVKMPVIKKKPVKGPGAGEKAYPMPGIGTPRTVGGGIVGATGKNVNSVYNTYP